MEFTPQELWAHTGTPVRIVIAVMMLMAVACVYVAVDRTLALQKARKQSRLLAQALALPMSEGDHAQALGIVKKSEFDSAYLAHLLDAGLTEFNNRPDQYGIQSTERALDRVSVNEGAALKKGLNILATTGSTAPFVGLVGTIFGIINAFAGMAETGSGGLGAVSAGIAEALVTTAIGITVAIIGVWLYNFFNAWIERITDDMSVASQEFVDWCQKIILPPVDTAAK